MDTETVFKALADGTRRHLLQLSARHELSVGELVDCLRLPQSTVSRHLKVLRDASLIQDRREGNTVRYATVAPIANGAGVRGDATPVEGLQQRMLDWIGEQPLPPALSSRLGDVLTRRKTVSDDFFSKVGHRWDQMRIDAFGDAFHLEAFTILLPQEWSVVDVGTGTGYLLPTLSRSFREVIAVDPVPEMLDEARARSSALDLDNIDFREGDFSRIPTRDARVDLALAVLVIHHVPSPAEALAELFRVVKPGGRILVVEQQAHELGEFFERMQDHWWGFEADALAQLVEEAGFTGVRHFPLAPVSAADAPGLFALTAQKKLAAHEPNKNIPIVHNHR